MFAFTVIGGAFLGQHWGLGGVATGVLAAITLNFVLMTQLSLTLTGLGWRAIAAAHRPALALTATLGPATWAMVAWLRSQDLSPLALLLDVGLFAVACSAALCWSLPRIFLGQDAQSLLRTLVAIGATRLRRPVLEVGGRS